MHTALQQRAPAICAAGDKWPERAGDMKDWHGPDILFAGFQEIIPLNAVTVVAGGSTDSINAWNECMDSALNCKPLPDSYIAAQVQQPTSLGTCMEPCMARK
jgi:hypothetical protein